MDCRECSELLPLYIDHTLSASEIDEIKNHLHDCRACGRELSKLEETVNLICGLECVEPPEDFHRRFMARFNRECPPVRGWNIWGTMALSTAAAAAMVLLVVVMYNPLPPVSDMQQYAESQPAQPSDSQKAEALPPALAKRRQDAPVRRTDPSGSDLKTAAESAPPASDAESESSNAPAASAASRPYARRAGGLTPLITAVDFTSGAAKTTARSLQAAGEPAETLSSAPLVRWNGEWSGDSCQVKEPGQQVLRSPEALRDLWQSAGLQSLPMPEVDWRREMIGAIFLGEKPTGGYEVQLRELQRLPDALMVKYAVRSPEGPASAQLTQPFLVFRLPATTAPVQFTQE